MSSWSATVGFNDLPWLASPWQLLQNAVSAERFHHALLLVGPKGVGKSVFNESLTAGLLCETVTDSLSQGGCGHCKGCQLLQSQAHPDCRHLNPESASLGIDDVRDASHFIQGKPQRGTRKVLCIDNIERLTEPAANALLKTLEEPTKGAYLLMSTSNKAALLPTIISRCFALPIKGVADSVAVPWLGQFASHIHRDDLTFLLKLGAGAPLQVKNWVEAQHDVTILDAKHAVESWLGQQTTMSAVVESLEAVENCAALLSLIFGQWIQSQSHLTITTQQQISQLINRFHRDSTKITGANKRTLLLRTMVQLSSVFQPNSANDPNGRM